MPIMTFAMTYYAYIIQSQHGAQLDFTEMYISGLITSILISFVCAYLLFPILLKLVYKSEETSSEEDEYE